MQGYGAGVALLSCPGGHLVAGFQGGRSPPAGRLPSRVSALSQMLSLPHSPASLEQDSP